MGHPAPPQRRGPEARGWAAFALKALRREAGPKPRRRPGAAPVILEGTEKTREHGEER